MLNDYFLLTLLNYRQDYKLGTGIPVRAQRVKENQLSRDQMCVMKMKAIARAAGGELVSFFAVIDTGATRTCAPVPWPNSCVILG